MVVGGPNPTSQTSNEPGHPCVALNAAPQVVGYRRSIRRRVCCLFDGQRFTTALTGRGGFFAGIERGRRPEEDWALVFLDGEPEGRELAPEIVVLIGTLRKAAA